MSSTKVSLATGKGVNGNEALEIDLYSLAQQVNEFTCLRSKDSKFCEILQ